MLRKFFVMVSLMFVMVIFSGIMNGWSQEYIDSYANKMLLETINHPIQFTTFNQPPPTEEYLLTDIALFNMDLMVFLPENMSNSVGIEKMKQEFWHYLQTTYPALKLPKYSRQNYIDFIVSIPKRAAKYGMFCKIEQYYQCEGDNFLWYELIPHFYKVDEIETRTCQIFDKNISADILFISSDLPLNKITLSNDDDSYFGECTYDCIVVNRPVIKEYEKFVNAQYSGYQQKYRDYKISLLPNCNYEQAIDTGTKKFYQAFKPENCEQRLIAHEFGHLYSLRDKKFMNHFPVKCYTSVKEYLEYDRNFFSHSELAAYLSEWRYSETRWEFMMYLITCYDLSDEHFFDHSHDVPLSILTGKLLECLKTDISDNNSFNINLNNKNNIDLQLLSNISKLDENPDKLNHII